MKKKFFKKFVEFSRKIGKVNELLLEPLHSQGRMIYE